MSTLCELHRVRLFAMLPVQVVLLLWLPPDPRGHLDAFSQQKLGSVLSDRRWVEEDETWLYRAIGVHASSMREVPNDLQNSWHEIAHMPAFRVSAEAQVPHVCAVNTWGVLSYAFIGVLEGDWVPAFWMRANWDWIRRDIPLDRTPAFHTFCKFGP